jgi:hypothetical protein
MKVKYCPDCNAMADMSFTDCPTCHEPMITIESAEIPTGHESTGYNAGPVNRMEPIK